MLTPPANNQRPPLILVTTLSSQEIDGAALLCLEQHDLMHVLGMKLGPAVKVFSAIQTLRRSLLATPLSELSPEQSLALVAAASCFSKSSVPALRRHSLINETPSSQVVVVNSPPTPSVSAAAPQDADLPGGHSPGQTDDLSHPPVMDKFCPTPTDVVPPST